MGLLTELREGFTPPPSTTKPAFPWQTTAPTIGGILGEIEARANNTQAKVSSTPEQGPPKPEVSATRGFWASALSKLRIT